MKSKDDRIKSYNYEINTSHGKFLEEMMAEYDFDVIVKIGSMALIRKEDNDIDYNIIARLAKDLRPGYILVSSGATEIGRIDYMKRNNGFELRGDMEEIKTDYSSQGQTILMEFYRRFINEHYSVRQVLVEHSHFNDKEKEEHLRRFFFRCANQNAIPIVNYNDPVSNEENRKMEISALREKSGDDIVECVDNDETAAVIAGLVHAKKLVILTSSEGIYMDAKDPSTLIGDVYAENMDEMNKKIDELITYCHGASRKGANGAAAKLQFARRSIMNGCEVIIAHARHSLSDILAGKVKCTKLGIR